MVLSVSLRCAALSTAALGLALAMAPALAQDAPPSSDAQLADDSALTTTESDGETVVVKARRFVPEGSMTATKSSVPLVKTPQSISVITRDQIDLLNVTDIQQAVRYTAGIVGENYGPDIRYDFLTQRGFIPAQYIDGLLAPVSASIVNNGVDLYGFQTVDVLKGPASALYGTTPPGGIYNLTSRRPSEEFDGELQAKIGTDEFYQVAGTVSGTVVEGITARLTALYRDRGSQTDFVQAERIYIAPAVAFDLSDDTKLTLLGYYQKDQNTGDTNGFLPVLGTLERNPLGQIDRGTNLGEPDYNSYDREQLSGGYELVHNLSRDLTVTHTARWSDYEEFQKVIYATSLGADNRTVGRSNFPFADDVRQFATDNRVDWRVQTGEVYHRILVGIDYRNYREQSAFAFAAAPSIDLFNPVYSDGPFTTPDLFPFTDQRLKQLGIYIQDQIEIDALTLTLSGRQDWIKQTNYAGGGRAITEQDEFTYRVGASYLFESGIAPYISYATSFEPVVGTDINGRQFQPSEGEQIEAGIKYDARGLGEEIKLFATAAVFQITQSNLVTSVPVGAPVSSIQTGEVEVTGVELEAVARIREQLSINASYTYSDGEVTESNGPDLGAPLANLPRHKVSMFVDYTLQSGPLAGLGFGFGGRYLSSAPGGLPGPFAPIVYYNDQVTLFDAAIHYDTPEWRLAINGSNIFDEEYVARCTSAVGCFFGEGADVFVAVTRKF